MPGKEHSEATARSLQNAASNLQSAHAEIQELTMLLRLAEKSQREFSDANAHLQKQFKYWYRLANILLNTVQMYQGADDEGAQNAR